MLCSNTLRRLIYSLLFVFSVAFISFSFSSSSYALEDITYTFTEGDRSFSPCSVSDTGTWCGRKYLYFTFDPAGSSISYSFKWSGYSTTYQSSFTLSYSSFVLLTSPPTSGVSTYTDFTIKTSTWLSSGQYIYITLSDSLPSDFPVSTPSGSISITENGTFDVTDYAQAVVDVPAVPGDYHDDLVSINNTILLVPAVCLVIYFFYAIYKMLLGGRK